ncbi:MAG: RidA family protein [SAR202 cluster bacterium]|nr:RidA family protein [SAR202 cluster bacterium]
MQQRHINPPGVYAPPPGMYTHVVAVGRTLYVSGLLPYDEEGKPVGGEDVEAQYEQAWRNLTLALGAAGATVSDLVRTTTYIVGQRHVAAVRDVRRRIVPKPPPASTLIVVAGLADPACLVEVDAIAVIGSGRSS